MRRDHVASTLIRRHFDVVCLLGDIVSYARYLKYGLDINGVVLGQISFTRSFLYDLYNEHIAEANSEFIEYVERKLLII